MHENKNTFRNNIIHFMAAGTTFFLVTMPFRYYFSLMSVTEIRPAAALPPFFGMVYGLPGALGCAVFNLVADMISGYSFSMCLISFPIQFLMGAIPYYMWYHIPAVKGEKITFPKLDKTAHVVKYLLIILCDSAVITFLLGMVMDYYGIAEVLSQTTLMMFWNNLDFGFMIGIPLLILVGIRKGRRFSLNERLILIFLLLAILTATLAGVGVWLEAVKVSDDRIYLWNRIYLDVAIVMNVFLFVEIMFLIYLEKKITIPIQKLADYAGDYVKIEEEKLDSQKFINACKTYAEDRMEVGHLARSYIRMISELDEYMENLKAVTAEKERIGAELSVATKIQADMLPSIFPAFPDRKEFDIYATMNPAKEVGGDFYDFFMVDESHIALVMADVSGKGVPAALFMVIAKTLIKNRTLMGGTPAQILSDVNAQLCEGNTEELFVTVWLAIFDLSTGKGVAANAGHEHPVIKRKDGEYQLVKYKHSPAVATMDGIHFKEHEFELSSGDCLYVYTDGVPEATDANGKLFDTERMLEVLNANADKSMMELLPEVKKAIDDFVMDAPQFDDITMLGFKYN